MQTSDCEFSPRFTAAEVHGLATAYWDEANERERKLETSIILEIAPSARTRGHFTRADLIELCRWKSARSAPRAEANTEEYVQAVTATALATSCNERLRVEVLMLLDGVGWPTASVLLHFGTTNPTDPSAVGGYPILDFRALSSVRVAVPPQYHFDFWYRYVEFCRALSKAWQVDMRTLDRALWQHSKRRQRATEARTLRRYGVPL